MHLVAIGSSFASGPGIPPIIDQRAQRSGRNYAHSLASSLGAELTDLSSSGATLLNVLNEPQRHFLGGLSQPQLDKLPETADYVFLTAGGNDISYSGSMLADAYRASIKALPLFGSLACSLMDSGIEGSPLTVEELTDRFLVVIDKINKIAPNARVFLVEYLTIFTPLSKPGPGNPLSKERMAIYCNLAELLQTAFRNASNARPSVTLVPASEMSLNHGVGSSEPWVTSFQSTMLIRGIVPYHPNAVGHEKIAQELQRPIED